MILIDLVLILLELVSGHQQPILLVRVQLLNPLNLIQQRCRRFVGACFLFLVPLELLSNPFLLFLSHRLHLLLLLLLGSLPSILLLDFLHLLLLHLLHSPNHKLLILYILFLRLCLLRGRDNELLLMVRSLFEVNLLSQSPFACRFREVHLFTDRVNWSQFWIRESSRRSIVLGWFRRIDRGIGLPFVQEPK